MRPDHLPKSPSNGDSDINDLFNGVEQEDAPQFFVVMDGKPSDSYKKNSNYCLAMLSARDISVFFSLGKRLEKALKRKKFRFTKVTRYRKKRREKYINAVLDILIDISIKERGLRYNWRIAAGPSEVMNPNEILQYLEYNESVRELLNAEVHDNYIDFKYGNKEIKVGHNEFGGMIWWHKNLLQIEAQYKAKERNVSWWVHMDRLPFDDDLERTEFFTSMMDLFFNNKVWMSVSGTDKRTDELVIDILPDFYAYIHYEAIFNGNSMNPSLLKKIQTLATLNHEEYWSNN